MVEVRPFRGIRYTSWVARDADRLLCPPYDMGPEQRRILRARHPYNAVWLEVPEGGADDTPDNNRYTRARDTFRRWIDEGSLACDPSPAFYLLRQRFEHQGVEYTRLGLLATVRLEEFEKGVVLPHERTMPGPKRDRLALMSACRANFSPLMVLHRDPEGRVAGLLRSAMKGEPALAVRDAEDNLCELWMVSDAAVTGPIQRALEPHPLYMADGHHRYEAALAHRDEMRGIQGDGLTPRKAFNYVMMALIAFDDPSLLVLPHHRVLGGLPETLLGKVWEELRELFEVSSLNIARTELPDALVERVAREATQRPAIGLLQAEDKAAYLLTLRRQVDPARFGPLGAFEGWLLEERVLRSALSDALGDHIAYLQDAGEALRRVESGESQLAFLLRAIPLDLFESVVSRGQRLPPKSTCFHPKLPTGLVFNSLEGGL